MWKQGDLVALMKEVKFTQEKFANLKKARFVQDISKVFAILALQGKVSAANRLFVKESSSSLSGMDAKLCRRILSSKNFKIESKILREELAILTRILLKTSYHPSSH